MKLTLLSTLVYQIFANQHGTPFIITADNEGSVLAESEVVFVAFVAEWCHFSRMLTPVWNEAAQALARTYPKEKLSLGVVQTDKQGASLGQKYAVNKFPTMKLFRGGKVTKKEYRGMRTVEAFSMYLSDQLRNVVNVFENESDLVNGINTNGMTGGKPIVAPMDRNRKNVIGYFENTDSQNYKNFESMAGNLKDDCRFWAGVGPNLAQERLSGDNIVFKPEGHNSADQVFMGDISNYDLTYNWVHEHCVPLVREITFQNGEELTEEGLPFVILFHKMEDSKSLQDYTKVIENETKHQRDKVNFLHADCHKFSHPLFHLGKGVNDCPVIAIDSFKHMYNFPKFTDIFLPGKFNQFIEDLHSGKLHREFHNGPDPTQPPQIGEVKTSEEPTTTKIKIEVVKRDIGEDPNKAKIIVKKTDESSEAAEDKKKQPPESQFKKLKPSELQYSILKKKLDDEL